MSMTDEQAIDFLRRTGHLDYPFGDGEPERLGPAGRAILLANALDSVASYQTFEAELVDRHCLKHHGRSMRPDGEIGPATIAAMETPRCGHPDYGPEVEAAIGNGGGWAGCYGIGDFHHAKIYVDESGFPGFLASGWQEVLSRTQKAYDDIGLHFTWVGSPSEANITVQFVSQYHGWIGLAIVGQAESCSSKIWAKFFATYRPTNVVADWTELVMHEHGHNAGLSHSRGGIMNPSIITGLAPTWRGDPSEAELVRMYGGVPYGGNGEPGEEFWQFQGLKSNKGRTEWVELAVPIPIEG